MKIEKFWKFFPKRPTVSISVVSVKKEKFLKLFYIISCIAWLYYQCCLFFTPILTIPFLFQPRLLTNPPFWYL